jgi:hypothetical protein
MEITNSEDLGADLFAPMADGSGRPYWGYELITYVQPGDSETRAADAKLRQVQSEIEAEHPGGTLYFPFGFSDKRELRAQQTYFVKMPVKCWRSCRWTTWRTSPDLSRARARRARPPRGWQRLPRGLRRSQCNRVASREPRHLGVRGAELQGRPHRLFEAVRPGSQQGLGTAVRRGQGIVGRGNERRANERRG